MYTSSNIVHHVFYKSWQLKPDMTMSARLPHIQCVTERRALVPKLSLLVTVVSYRASVTGCWADVLAEKGATDVFDYSAAKQAWY